MAMTKTRTPELESYQAQAFAFYLSNLLQRRGKDELTKNVITEYASDISHESYPRDVLHIPAKRYLLKTHDHHARGGADDEH